MISLDSDLTEFVRKTTDEESMVCAKHSNVTLKYFCQVCEALVRSECVVLDHFGQEIKEIRTVLHVKKAEMQLACSALEQALPSLLQAQDVVTMNDIIVNGAKVKREIEEAFVAILATAEKREKELLVEAEAMAVAKKTRLRMQ